MDKYNIIYYEDGKKITRVTSDSLDEAIKLKDECEKCWKVSHIIEKIAPRRIKKIFKISLFRFYKTH